MTEQAQPVVAEAPKVLSITKEIEAIRASYKSDDQYRALVYGVSGTGKTYSLRTARRPIHIDSFDPDGTQSIDDCIKEGWIYADTRFEGEDPSNPRTWDLYSRELKRRHSAGYFNHIGTYAGDSLTSIASGAMYAVLKAAGRPGGIPYENDWMPQMTRLENLCRFLMSLPCDVIMLAHVDVKEDKVSGKLSYAPLLTGKLTIRIPLLFSELYVAMTKETAKGLEYKFLTQAAGNYTARTRIGKGGALAQYEVPSYKEILKKCGRNYEDKPY